MDHDNNIIPYAYTLCQSWLDRIVESLQSTKM